MSLLCINYKKNWKLFKRNHRKQTKNVLFGTSWKKYTKWNQSCLNQCKYNKNLENYKHFQRIFLPISSSFNKGAFLKQNKKYNYTSSS